MMRRFAILLLFPTALSGCSYAYELLAVAQGGRLAFIVDPSADEHPACLRQIEVLAEGSTRAEAEAGDDAARVGYGTYWYESVGYDDDCENKFPVKYGDPLKGVHQEDRGTVRAKPLLRGVVYNVSATTGATGYGNGRFVIHADGRIENLPGAGMSSGLTEELPAQR